MRTTLSLIATLGVATAANAQSVILDGTADAAYGKPVAIQNTQTGFGNATQGTIDVALGSELACAYAKVEDGFLFLVLAGNLESNFNKLEIFIDGVDGGQNRLRGNNPDVDFNGLNRMGDDGSGNGLTFDKGFAPDLWVSLTCGGNPFAVYMNQAQLLTKGGGTGGYLGSGGAGLAGSVTFKSGFGFGLDNSNVGGVGGGTGIEAPTPVTTGVEVKVPLAAIPGYTSGDLRICAFINGGGHDYLSNQVLGPLGGGENLAEPRSVNFANVPGDQFFVVSASSGPACPADLDNSGNVDASDLAAVLGAWGTAAGDIDGDGLTDAADLAALLGAWGPCV
ncbi:MAG: hypothetical protein RLY21_726 [Planctomycetota bacterium]|jgi:hypothetical protein